MARILSLDNQTPDFFFRLALEQMEAGGYYDAILNLIKARELRDDPQYVLHLAEAYFHTKNYAQSTNLYIELFFRERRVAYILAIYRNLILMGRSRDAKRFVLDCLRDSENITADDIEALPEMNEEDLQRVLGLVENNDVESFFDIKEAKETFAEEILDEFRELVEKGNYDKAIMRALEVKPDSALYNGAQEIICIAASERGDLELAEKTARAHSERMPDSMVAFCALALMPDRVSEREIEERLQKLALLVGSDPAKAVSLLRVLARTRYTALFDKYLQAFYLDHPCAFSLIAYKAAVSYARGNTEEGSVCIRRLQMLFPDDFLTRAYTALADSKTPEHCWQQMLHIPFCTDAEDIYKKVLQEAYKERKSRNTGEKLLNLLCALIAASGEEDISYLIRLRYSHPEYGGVLTRFFIRALSDIHLEAEQKFDLIYGMLMNGWDIEADVMPGDTYLHCRIAALDSVNLPLQLARIYCEIYVQMISDAEEPDPEALLSVIRKMERIGVKKGMSMAPLLAVGHYLYELSLGAEEEDIGEYTELYGANPKTVEKYFQIYKGVLDNNTK